MVVVSMGRQPGGIGMVVARMISDGIMVGSHEDRNLTKSQESIGNDSRCTVSIFHVSEVLTAYVGNNREIHTSLTTGARVWWLSARFSNRGTGMVVARHG
jgi:hypothetical protein